MYMETVDKFASLAAGKADYLRSNPAGFFLSAMMAGAYVGLGIVLIFTLGADAEPGMRKLIMGASFGIALILVVFAGADLFTGLTMTMTHGGLAGRIGWLDAAKAWALSWIGNFAGAGLLCLLFVAGGSTLVSGKTSFLADVAAAKMTAAPASLFARAVLCNWLVCLAIWMSARMTSDAAKCIAIFWCLFAFIASGYEHSVANMTLLLLALLSPHPETVSLGGLAHNLLWVTLGNMVSGILFMGIAYWRAARPRPAIAVSAPPIPLVEDVAGCYPER